MDQHDFLLRQYRDTGALEINHNYLAEQFADADEILDKLRVLVKEGDFTLGAAVAEFEDRFAKLTGTRFALGVGSGTDALFLSLKALGVGPGDEVVTTPYTFFATVGAIVTAGARPVFADVRDDYNIDPEQIAQVIGDDTRAILPVHWSGNPCDMDAILRVAEARDLPVVEDACHGIQARYRDKPLGSFGATGCFSMHPLKNLNVWGDGGVVVTDDEALHERLGLLRNHGLVSRDECAVFAYNSRLDTLQAIVANHLLDKIDGITEARRRNSLGLDTRLTDIPQITIPERSPEKRPVFHIYVIRAERRDDLQSFLVERGIDAKVHYPIPMHLQPAAKSLGYQRGDFPVAEAICESVISLPVHEFISESQLDAMAAAIRTFYG